MNKNIKRTGILLAILGIPVFIFLHFRGSVNQHFELPVYQSAEGAEAIVGNYEMQLIDQDQIIQPSDDYLAVFFNAGKGNWGQDLTLLNTVANAHSEDSSFVIFIHLLGDSSTYESVSDAVEKTGNVSKYKMVVHPEDLFNEISKEHYNIACYDDEKFGWIPEHKTVLVDDQMRIRGFYKTNNRKAVERLIKEWGILKKEGNE